MSRSKCNGRESTTTEYEEKYTHTPYFSSGAWGTSSPVYSRGWEGTVLSGSRSMSEMYDEYQAEADRMKASTRRVSEDAKGLTRYLKSGSDEYKIP